jgi:pilus assembly protein CpaB
MKSRQDGRVRAVESLWKVKRMKAARIVVLGIAVAAGGLAAILAGSSFETGPAPPPQVVQVPTTEILVAKNDIGMGTTLSGQDIEWQAWPESAAQNPAFIRKNERPEALQQFAGAIVRVPMAAGEPVRANKLIIGKNSGFMAAILPSGMRAYATEVSPETGVAGFILPNDRVDVLLTPKHDRTEEDGRGKRELEYYAAETILTDVRVLAIDQLVQEKDGQRVVIGRTATLELTPRQSELLAAARQSGVITLALRSIVDAGVKTPGEPVDPGGRFNTVRFGVPASTIAR